MHLREDKTIYIGKAKNITKRHQQHVQQGHPMSFIALFFCPVGKLNDKETELIERAERLGLVLANREKKTPSILFDGTLVFDELYSPERQAEFFNEIERQSFRLETQMNRVIDAASQAHRESWALFNRRADADDILRLGALYLSIAVPNPKEMEASFWIATLTKFNNQNKRIPLLSITTGRGAGLEIFCFARSEFAAFAEVRLASTIVAPNEKAAKLLRERFPWVSWSIPEMKPFTTDELEVAQPFGPYESPIEQEDDLLNPSTQAALRPSASAVVALSHFQGLIEDLLVAKAAAVHAVSKMRMGVAMRPEFHNPIAGFALTSRIAVDVLS